MRSVLIILMLTLWATDARALKISRMGTTLCETYVINGTPHATYEHVYLAYLRAVGDMAISFKRHLGNDVLERASELLVAETTGVCARNPKMPLYDAAIEGYENAVKWARQQTN